MILAYDTFEDLYLKCMARLSDQLSCLKTYVSLKVISTYKSTGSG